MADTLCEVIVVIMTLLETRSSKMFRGSLKCFARKVWGGWGLLYVGTQTSETPRPLVNMGSCVSLLNWSFEWQRQGGKC